MIKLETKNDTEIRLFKYLEENASEELINKINSGTPFNKEGKPFINKKTLSGFMKYANGEAKKIAGQGKSGLFVDDDIVFGWLMHYFEEDSIEGKLYNPDGTEYAPPKKEFKPTTTTTSTPPKTEPKKQPSLFDMISVDKEIEEDEQPSQEEIDEAFEELEEQQTAIQEEKPTSPAYTNYLKIQDNYSYGVTEDKKYDKSHNNKPLKKNPNTKRKYKDSYIHKKHRVDKKDNYSSIYKNYKFHPDDKKDIDDKIDKKFT